MSARTTLCCVFTLLLLLCQTVGAFTTVINVPPDPVTALDPLLAPGGYLVAEGTQVNVGDYDFFVELGFTVSGGELNLGPGNTNGYSTYATVSDGGRINLNRVGASILEILSGGGVQASGSYLGQTSIYPGGWLEMQGGQAALIHLFGGGAVLEGVNLGRGVPGILGVAGGENGEPGFMSFSGGVLPEGNDAFRVDEGGTLELQSAVMPEYAGWVVDEGGTLDLQGYAFAIDGVLIEGLEYEAPLEIPDREFMLTGRFVDGSPFEVFVSEAEAPFGYPGVHLEVGGALQVTLAVPEPTGLGLTSGVLALAMASRLRRTTGRQQA